MGAYRLHAELGRGGMGVVYLARRLVGRPVALKALRPDLTSEPEHWRRFFDEATLLQRLAHPAFCRIHDVGQADGLPFFTMELLVGRPFSDLVRRAPEAPLAESLPVMLHLLADVADGLHVLHELSGSGGRRLGVVHRDLCPSNLFALHDGSIKILDLGIASWRGRMPLPGEGLLPGKPSYLSPEAIEGRPTDHRSDIWSLGVVLWEAITRERLFGGPDREARLRAVSRNPIPLPSQVRGDVPWTLDAVVAKALQRDPNDRFTDAHAMSQALRAIFPETTRADVTRWLRSRFPGDRDDAVAAIAAAIAGEPSSPLPRLPGARFDDGVTTEVSSLLEPGAAAR
ncbi:MAG: serine/threonine-protein kinase [Sandaracinaceae bacterium]